MASRTQQVWATHPLQCGKIDACIKVQGKDPCPQRQYKFPREAEGSIKVTIDALVEQQVLVEMRSTMNSPIRPVLKGDGTIWSLTIDYRQLNKSTPAFAPIVEKYPEGLASIAHGATWFTLLDLSNAFFAIPLHPDSWYKFAFYVWV